jgi:hypothetical protein
VDVAIAVIVVKACVCAIACQYALLPREHDTICDRTGTEGVPHHLAYITKDEMITLVEGGGWGKTKPGMFGTQGVKCFPKRARDDTEQMQLPPPYNNPDETPHRALPYSLAAARRALPFATRR